MLYTPLGSASGPLVAVDNFGCDSVDFPPVFSNSTNDLVALISRGGDCTFAQKSAFALKAGAAAVLIYNDDPAYRLNGTLAVTGEYVPTLGITETVGVGFRSLLRAGQTIEVSVSVTERQLPPPSLSTCADLSGQGRAFSTILTAFVGAIVSGLAAGFYAPAFSLVNVWLGPLRALVAGVYMFTSACMAIRHEPLIGTRKIGGDTFVHSYFRRRNEPAAFPTFWGWVGWVYLACYSPIMQILWLAANVDGEQKGILAARGVAVLALAIPLTLESRASYALWLKKHIGHGTGIMFYFITASAVLAMGAIAAVEIIKSVLMIVIIFGVIYGTALTFVSFIFGTPDDEGEAQTHWRQWLGGVAMGVLCGFVVGAPAIAMYVNADGDSGVGLLEYLSCGEVAWWRKMVAILP